MAKLSDLFNESFNTIYNKYKPDSDQFLVINPGKNNNILEFTKKNMQYDSRALPVSSVIRDVVRVSKLLNPFRGPSAVLLTGKQALLQTGNTFQETRVYNIFSGIINVTPFLHTLRMVKPDPYPYLQSETLVNLSRKFNYTISVTGPITNEMIKKNLSTFALYARPEFHAFYNYPSPSGWTGPRLYAHQSILTRGQPRDNVVPLAPRDNTGYATEFVNAVKNFRANFRDSKNDYLKGGLKRVQRNNRLRSSYITDNSIYLVDTDSNELPSMTDSKSGLTLINDEINLPLGIKKRADSRVPDDRLDYFNITTDDQTLSNRGKNDIIKFIFSDASGKNVNPVQFRAFISAFKQNIRTEFNEQRYVGRTERYVTYAGAKRNVNLTFNIVAFSAKERDQVWSRINYLSGLAFPKDVANGFMIPPLFNITIGNIYDNQPCYMESLDYDFMDSDASYDIENEIPFVVTATMQLSLLEKRSKFSNSPFYAITEQLLAQQISDANRIRQEEADRALAEFNRNEAAIRDAVAAASAAIDANLRTPPPEDDRQGFNSELTPSQLQILCGENAACYESPWDY